MKREINRFLKQFTSNHTKLSYRRSINDFFDKYDSFNESNILDYKESLLEDGLSPSTIRARFSALKAYSEWSNEYLGTNLPSLKLKLPRNQVINETSAFTDEEVTSILNEAKGPGFRNNYEYITLKLLFNLGLRRSELVKIKLKDIKSEGKHKVLTILGKRHKYRKIPLNEKLIKDLSYYVNKYKDYTGVSLKSDDYLIQSGTTPSSKPISTSTVYRMIKKYCEKTNITRNLSPHSCRATIISRMLEEGISPRDVASFAGHSNINTTINSYDKKRDGIENSPVFKVGY